MTKVMWLIRKLLLHLKLTSDDVLSAFKIIEKYKGDKIIFAWAINWMIKKQGMCSNLKKLCISWSATEMNS